MEERLGAGPPNDRISMNGIAFTVSLVLFVGGILLFGWAFEAVGFEGYVFFAGIAAIVASIAIPFHVLKRTDR